MSTLITYKIESDSNDMLKNAGKLACGFWNRFITPDNSVVIRLGVFSEPGSNVIAKSYQPFIWGDVVYGVIQFNTRFLATFTETGIVGTIIHEIGHTLGFGWDQWMRMFDPDTGAFKPEYIEQLPDLSFMRVETDYGAGTRLAHWDEQDYGRELMTGFKDSVELVMPVTIDVMELLGHTVKERLDESAYLADLIQELKQTAFNQQALAQSINRDHFQATQMWEETRRG
ncbi:MAG: hypothetical protein RJA44_940 [Pseudomonadota bacterium]